MAVAAMPARRDAAVAAAAGPPLSPSSLGSGSGWEERGAFHHVQQASRRPRGWLTRAWRQITDHKQMRRIRSRLRWLWRLNPLFSQHTGTRPLSGLPGSLHASPSQPCYCCSRRMTTLLLALCASCLILGFFVVQPLLMLGLPDDKAADVDGTGMNSEPLHMKQLKLQQRLQQGSSIYCSETDDINTRRCQIENMCFRMDEEEGPQYLFLHGPDTVVDNVPENRFDPGLATLSSVMNHNLQYFNYIDVQARLFDFNTTNITFVLEPALLFRRFKPDNIMHTMHDDLLPLFFTLRSEFGGGWLQAQLVFADGFATDLPTQHLYQQLSDRTIMYLQHRPTGSNHLTCFSSLHVGISKRTTWYDYGFSKPQGPIPDKVVDGRDLRLFARFIQSRIQQKRAAATPAITAASPIVVFSRTRNRFILNEATLIKQLRAELRAPVVVLRMETHTFEEQVELLARSRAAIGMHGSMLVMSMFLPPGAVLLELFPYAVPPHHYTPYRTMAQLKGMDLVYAHWANRFEANTVPHPDRPPHLGGIVHLSVEQQQQIREAHEVPQHVCCMNPFWLYRIYQDTYVDIYAVLQLLRENAISGNGPTLDTLRLSPGHPHKPRDVSCSLTTVPVENDNPMQALYVSWRPPTNAADVAVSHYEVWVQELMRVFQTSDTFLAIDASSVVSLPVQTIWVRGIALYGPHTGPFAAPVTCSMMPQS